MQPTKPRPRTTVTADGEHVVSHAGSLLLAETADTVGLTSQLGRRANLGLRAGAPTAARSCATWWSCWPTAATGSAIWPACVTSPSSSARSARSRPRGG